MDYIDYYKILGVDKNATAEDIKKSYRKLARKHHPDLNPGDPEAVKLFQQINEANEVLSDPENRKKYDQYGKEWKHADQFEEARRRQQDQNGYSSGNPFGDGEYYTNNGGNEGGFSDFFESIFGHRTTAGGANARFRGQDIRATLELKLSEVYHTHKQSFTVNGKKIRITVPAGVENGQEIKISGFGSAGANGGPNGDLYITFSIKNDTNFTRKQNDLYTTVPLNLYTALLGGEQMIDTLSGTVKLKVAPETQNGTKVRLKGKGFPVYKKDDTYGDLYITYEVKLPTNLTAKEKDLIEQLSNERK